MTENLAVSFVVPVLSETDSLETTVETIYPEEIEPYYASPFFTEHCVAAVRDREGNDIPILFVVPSSSDTARGDR